MVVEARLSFSKKFKPGQSEFVFGRYKLIPIPPSNIDSAEAILSFDDIYQDSKGGSNPVEEIDIVCKLISVFFDVITKRENVRINNVDIPTSNVAEKEHYPNFFGILDLGLKHYELFLSKILSLDEDMARQFIRACNSYSFAIEHIPSDPTFAFFLLVVAIECLSSQDSVIPFIQIDPKDTCDRFCAFIKNFLTDELKGADEHNDVLFTKLLKNIYHSLRSGFVHGGKEVSFASLAADRLGSSYFKHSTEGKEVKTPGIGWFAKVVRGSLMGYVQSLHTLDSSHINEALFSKLAFEKSILRMNLKNGKGKGEIVTAEDIDYR
jgi:hypothetical protein